jgi:phosphonate transport system substrate-binding protein
MEVPTRIGVGIAVTTDPQMTRGLLEQLCLALADATGLEVVPRGVATYQRLLDQLGEEEVDLVWLPPILALRAIANHHVKPIALPIRNGESTYRAALFTRSDSRQRAIEDLEGLRAAWVDPQSAAGYLIIRAHLEKQGVDLGRAFRENRFYGSHAGVSHAVRDGLADVGATFVYLDEGQRPKRAGWGMLDMRVIAHAGPIPNDMVAARAGLSSLLVRLIQSALIDVHNAQLREAARVLLAAEGFVVPTSEHLEPLEHLLAGLHEADEKPHSMFPPPLDR